MCDSIMKIMELCAKVELGPIIRNRLGNPDTVEPA